MAYIRTYYGLYFSGSGGVVRLPINPEKLPITWANDNKEYNVLDIGHYGSEKIFTDNMCAYLRTAIADGSCEIIASALNLDPFDQLF